MPGFLVKKENNRYRCNNLQQDKIQIPCSGKEEENILSRIQKNGINRNIGVTCTFHPNISPCVNLKNDGFSDFTGTLLSFIKK